jgi:FG-GAP-like repeat/Bacterial Ig-like domain/Putative Ig domain
MSQSRRGPIRSLAARPQFEPLETRRLLDASGLFEPLVTENVGVNPRSVALGDLNGDGADDLVIGHGSGLLVRLNDGSGNFATSDTHLLDPGFNRVLIADLTGDGIPDIAGSTTTEGGARIFTGVGDGSFTLSDSVDLVGIPTSITSVDIDGDTDLDLLVPILTGSAVHILTNDGSGDFTGSASTAPGASFPMGVEAADLAGDGSLRIVTAGLGDSQVVLAKEFTPVPGVWLHDAAFPVGAQPQSLAIADVDGDGDIDILTGDQFGEGLALLLNHGDGTFADYVGISTADPIGSLVFGDLDYDGNLDIVAGSLGDTTVFVLLGNGDGTFMAATQFEVGFGVEYIDVGDADNDAFDDIVIVGGSKVAFLHNTRQAPSAPVEVDLADGSDRGDDDQDNLTNLNNAAGSELSFVISGVEVGATVRVYAGDTLVAEGVAADTVATLTGNGTTLADGFHSITASQTDAGSGVESERSPGFTLTIDTVGPAYTSAGTASANADEAFAFNVESDAEAAGSVYTLTSGPVGLDIIPATGVLTWNASMLQLGDHEAIVSIDDAAGNSASETITITVSAGAPRPDVISTLDTSSVFATLVPGDKKAKAVVSVGNQGNDTAQGPITITVFASVDDTIDGGDLVLGQLTKNLKVNPGDTKAFSVKLLVPSAAAAGTYTLLASVDTANVADERREGNDDAIAAGSTDIAWRFGSFDGRSNVKLVVPDQAANAVTFKMSGAGFGEITGGPNFTTIDFTGVASSNLKITVAGGAPLTLHDVNVNGSLSAFKAPTATIAGTLTSTGAIGTAQWRAVTGAVNVAGINNLKLAGDTSGDWNITGAGLSTAKIGGSITGGTFAVSAGETNLKLSGSVAAAATLAFNALGTAKIGGNLLADLTTSYVNKLTVGGQWSGIFTATRTSAPGAANFTVKGAAVNAVLDAIGGIGKATFAALSSVSLYAGVDTSALADLDELPTSFAANATIAKLKVKGTTTGATIAASHFENLALGPVSALAELRLAASTANKVQMTLEGAKHKFVGDEFFEDTPALPYLIVERV